MVLVTGYLLLGFKIIYSSVTGKKEGFNRGTKSAITES